MFFVAVSFSKFHENYPQVQKTPLGSVAEKGGMTR